MKYVIIGLSVTSSWGNGHATTYRALLKELAKMENDILFLERDVPYYAGNRDLPDPQFCELGLYQNNEQLKREYEEEVRSADVVILGSYVKEGIEVGEWIVKTASGIKAFYDIDTPVTLAKLQKNDYEYLHPELIPEFDLYFSFSGGEILDYLQNVYHSPKAKALYCSVDPELYFPEAAEIKWQMGYLGTYSPDRQTGLETLLNNPASALTAAKFVVAGPQYPQDYPWAKNVERIEHLPPAQHRKFYNSQKYTLNITRDDMIRAGYSPSVRLFEAAACGVPVISDFWNGIDSIFKINSEILIAGSTSDVLSCFYDIEPEERLQIGENARKKVMKYHTAAARAKQLQTYVQEEMEFSKIQNI